MQEVIKTPRTPKKKLNIDIMVTLNTYIKKKIKKKSGKFSRK